MIIQLINNNKSIVCNNPNNKKLLAVKSEEKYSNALNSFSKSFEELFKTRKIEVNSDPFALLFYQQKIDVKDDFKLLNEALMETNFLKSLGMKFRITRQDELKLFFKNYCFIIILNLFDKINF